MNFQREDVKRLLLKRVLFRVDYRLLSSIEINEVVDKVKHGLKSYFTLFDVQTTKQANLELLENDINVNRLEDSIAFVFSFKDSKKDYRLTIHNQMSYFEIIPHGDSNGTDYYYDIFNQFIDVLKEIDLFSMNRFGLRKFNQFFIEADQFEKINSIFADNFISIWNSKHFRAKHLQDRFVSDNYSYNLSREIQHGKLEEKEVYLILFDYDVYLSEVELLIDFMNQTEDKLEEINNIIFELFTSSLQEDFINNHLVRGTLPNYIVS